MGGWNRKGRQEWTLSERRKRMVTSFAGCFGQHIEALPCDLLEGRGG